jgi:hypothetical protein
MPNSEREIRTNPARNPRQAMEACVMAAANLKLVEGKDVDLDRQKALDAALAQSWPLRISSMRAFT